MLPAAIVVTEGELVVTRSAWVARATTSVAVAVLFALLGSAVEELTVTVLLIAVPAAVPAFTARITVKLAVPGAKVALVQVMVPAAPTAGVVHAHPAGKAMDWKFVFGGVVSVIDAAAAVLGPPLVATCV